jgi:flagellar M-ring protein FliF
MSDQTIALRTSPTATKQGASLARLQDIPGMRQVFMLLALALAIGVGLWMFSWSQTPMYVPLYAELEQKDAAEIGDALRAAKFDFELDPSSGVITVANSKVQEARMLLASQGLPASPKGGYEAMQGEQGFGVSQFVELARYQHALETELARTIALLRPVKDARVHIAIPKSSAFNRPQDQASASVLINLYSGRTMGPDQVGAIVHLVASSIPGLAAERVAVVDQSGRLLTRQDADSGAALNAAQFEQTRRLEVSYQKRIEDLLEPMTGVGRVSAQVTAEMDFAISEEAREQFAPDPAKLRSEQVSEQSGGADVSAVAAPAQGVPGAASNTPSTATADTSKTSSPASSKSATRNFELDRTVSHVMTPAGRLRRVSAAVIVDQIPVSVTTADEAPKTRALSAEELVQVEKLVREAVGFDEKRGDSVSVMNSTFVRAAETDAQAQSPFWEQTWLRDTLRAVFGGAAVLVLLLGVLRPTVRGLVSPITLSDGAATLVSAGDGRPGAQLPQLAVDGYEQKLQLAKTAVGQDPKRVAQLVKGWVGNET